MTNALGRVDARFIAAMAWRETRASRRRLLLFGSAISIGVAALVAIGSFTVNVQSAVHREARGLLGADLALSGNAPFTPRIDSLLDSLAAGPARVARRIVFLSMGYVRRTEGIKNVEIRAVGPGFPFYGDVITSPAGAWAALDTGKVALVDTTVLVDLNARIGDTLELGNTGFRIAGTVGEVAGHLSGGMSMLGAKVYIPVRYVKQTDLLVFGSRATYSALVKFPAAPDAERFQGRYGRVFEKARVRSETADHTEQQVTGALSQLGKFLQLVSLIGLLLGGIGVASGIGAFLAQKLDTIAVLRCLGATRPLVFTIYLIQAAALGTLAAAFGSLLGVGLQLVLPAMLKGLLPVNVQVELAPLVLLEGIGIGVAVAVLFALRPLLEVRLVSPLQAIRKAYETADAGAARDPWRLAATGALLAGILLLCMNATDDPKVGIGFFVMIAGSVVVLVGAARAVVWAARRLTGTAALRRRWPYVLRQGVANLHQPRNQTRAVVTALGFGVGLLAALYLIQANFLTQLLHDTDISRARPNLVMMDVQTDQVDGVKRAVSQGGARLLDAIPMVPMRIASIDGRTPDQLRTDTGQGRRPERWAAGHEYRSTWRDTLVSSERLVAGHMWTGTGAVPPGTPWPVSLATDVARDLKVKLGDTIVWNVQGLEIPTVVASLREVDWARLDMNFFAVFPTAALVRAPATWVVLSRLDDAALRARLERSVAERYTNVTSFDIALVQRTVERILSRVTLAVRFMAALSLVTGTLVLLGAVAAGRLERIRQGALLKTLGATRRQIERMMLAEYVVLGLLSAAVGIGLAALGAWAFTHWVFDLRFVVPALPLGTVLLLTMVLTALVGLSGSREVFRRTAMEVLRDE